MSDRVLCDLMLSKCTAKRNNEVTQVTKQLKSFTIIINIVSI